MQYPNRIVDLWRYQVTASPLAGPSSYDSFYPLSFQLHTGLSLIRRKKCVPTSNFHSMVKIKSAVGNPVNECALWK
jgi:hypothetical protein